MLSSTAGSDALGSDRQHLMMHSTTKALAGSGRTLRMADNTQERLKKKVDDQKFLDTTPNADVNETWVKQCRRRNEELELGPPSFRFTHKNAIDRLHYKMYQDPITTSDITAMDRSSMRKLKNFNQTVS